MGSKQENGFDAKEWPYYAVAMFLDCIVVGGLLFYPDITHQPWAILTVLCLSGTLFVVGMRKNHPTQGLQWAQTSSAIVTVVFAGVWLYMLGQG